MVTQLAGVISFAIVVVYCGLMVQSYWRLRVLSADLESGEAQRQLRAIGRIGRRDREWALPALAALIRRTWTEPHFESAVQESAMSAMIDFGSSGVAELFDGTALSDSRVDDRLLARFAGALPPELSQVAALSLARGLPSGNRKARLRCLYLLTMLQQSSLEAVDGVKMVLSDPDSDLQLIAAQLLIEWGQADEEVVRALSQLVNTGAPGYSARAQSLLRRMSECEGVRSVDGGGGR